MEIWGGARAADEAVSVPGLDIYLFSRPFHDDVSGGDVYLVSVCGAGKIARIVLADVVGHGAAQSSIGRSLRQLMRKHVSTADQTQLARELNAAFTRISKEGRFATAVLATYFAPTDHLIVVNAGHPPPLWYRSNRQTWQLLEASPLEAHDTESTREIGVANLPLGIIEPTPYVQFAVQLRPDDLVVLYTDALIETRATQGEPLGTSGLLELVRSLDASAFEGLSVAIRNALGDLRGDERPDDDLTIVVLHHNAGNPPRLSVGERLRVLGRMMGIGRIEPRL